MYCIKSKFSFDSAHFLSGYNGKCANIHGHRWTVEVTVGSHSLIRSGQKAGMVMDFSDLKARLAGLAGEFDHKLIYEKDTLREDTKSLLERDGFALLELSFRPTAENLARCFFDSLKEMGFSPKSVAVYETPDNCAVYEEVI